MNSLAEIDAALAEDRLIVKVARSWWKANEVARVVDGDNFIIKVRAGPHQARGLITNIRDNAEGREFVILPTGVM